MLVGALGLGCLLSLLSLAPHYSNLIILSLKILYPLSFSLSLFIRLTQQFQEQHNQEPRLRFSKGTIFFFYYLQNSHISAQI